MMVYKDFYKFIDYRIGKGMIDMESKCKFRKNVCVRKFSFCFFYNGKGLM